MTFGGYRKLESIEPGFLKRETLRYLEGNGLPEYPLASLPDTEIFEFLVGQMYFFPINQKNES